MQSTPATEDPQIQNEHEGHDHECGCMTMKLLRYRTEDAQAAYLQQFGSQPHEGTMFFMNHWDVPEVLESAVSSNSPISPSEVGIKFEAMCHEYRERFGHEVVPRSIWLWGSPESIALWIDEALRRGRRRWVLEIGNCTVGTNEILVAAGLDPENTTIEDMLHVWLDPIESIREASSTDCLR